jgi:predicted transposase/invertase (TIGR01784 family)
MVLVWEQDLHEKRPLRPIIPVVFYHGKDKWRVPGSFVEQFKVDEEVKQFLLNYKYILFDTNPWDFRQESNQDLKDNVLLFTAMVLMKAAFKKDEEAIREIFRFWYEKGLLENKKMVLFFLVYIIHTQEMDQGKLDKILEESKINGGDFMETIAQRIIKEGKKDGKKEGIKEEKRETARRMLLNNFSVAQVITATGLTEKEIKKLMN